MTITALIADNAADGLKAADENYQPQQKRLKDAQKKGC